MAYNQQLSDRVREALMHVNDVEEKKMFGGIAFMVDKKMCITVGGDEIMCRIDPVVHDTLLEERTGCRTVVMKGRNYKGYIRINEEGLKTKTDFNFWIGLALEFTKKAKASKKKAPIKAARK